MSRAAEQVLQAFAELSAEDREAVFQALLRRTVESGYESFTDEELLAAGRTLFSEYDLSERR